MTCRCYVALLPPQERFSLRYGAHEESCPNWRESRDPVDRAADEAYRNAQPMVIRPRVIEIPADEKEATTDDEA